MKKSSRSAAFFDKTNEKGKAFFSLAPIGEYVLFSSANWNLTATHYNHIYRTDISDNRNRAFFHISDIAFAEDLPRSHQPKRTQLFCILDNYKYRLPSLRPTDWGGRQVSIPSARTVFSLLLYGSFLCRSANNLYYVPYNHTTLTNSSLSNRFIVCIYASSCTILPFSK